MCLTAVLGMSEQTAAVPRATSQHVGGAASRPQPQENLDWANWKLSSECWVWGLCRVLQYERPSNKKPQTFKQHPKGLAAVPLRLYESRIVSTRIPSQN